MPTTPDLGRLRTDAKAAQDALATEQERQAAAAKAVADSRTAREIEWSYQTILAYPSKLAAANAKVSTALASFRTAVAQDLNLAAAAYLEIAAAMGAANRLGEDVAAARGRLRSAGIIPPGRASQPDPIGINAPFVFAGHSPALPPFLDMLASELGPTRAAALRVPSTEDPAKFTGKATEAEQRAVLAAEYHYDEEWALLAALRLQYPARWESLSEDQKSATLAWLAARDAAGHGDDPLPKVAAEKSREIEPAAFAADDRVRVALNRWPSVDAGGRERRD